MDVVNTKIKSILTEKNNKIRPENIKNGVNILGIEGTLTVPSGTVSITSNGTTDVTNYASASVNVQPNLQSKSVTITENTTQTITAASGYDGLSSVEVTTNVSGSSFPPDWTNIGYSDTPNPVILDYNYAKNIYDNWDSSITSLWSTYYGNNNLVYFPLVDTSNVTTMTQAFNACTNLEYIPLIDTSKVQYWGFAFADCSNLVYIPQLSVAKAKNFDTMVRGCPRLSEDARNNILAMCANVTSEYTSTKTLRYIGILSAEISNWTGLTNWAAAQAAGWSTGY